MSIHIGINLCIGTRICASISISLSTKTHIHITTSINGYISIGSGTSICNNDFVVFSMSRLALIFVMAFIFG